MRVPSFEVPVYLFENFSLDTDRRELRSDGKLRPMEPQAFDLLEFLVRNRDRVATRGDILANVWSGRIVSDAALNTRMPCAFRWARSA